MSDFSGIAERDRRPLPVVVRERLGALILNGRFPPGSQLPSEDELAEQLAVSRPTLREALRALEVEGLLWRKRGVGTFVAQRPTLSNNLGENFGVTDLIERDGHRPGCRSMQVSEVEADENLSARLDVSIGEVVYRVERIRTADDAPVVFSIDVLQKDLIPEAPSSLQRQSIYHLLQQAGWNIHYGIAQITPVKATKDLAEKLEVPSASPLLLLDQVDYGNDDRPLLYSREWHVPDAFEITVYRKGPHQPT